MFGHHDRSAIRHIVGVPNDRLDHWLKSNILRSRSSTSGRGNRRRFSTDDLLLAGILHDISAYAFAKSFLVKFATLAYELLAQGKAGIAAENVHGLDRDWIISAYRRLYSPDAIGGPDATHLIWDIGFIGNELILIHRDAGSPCLVQLNRAQTCLSINITLVAKRLWERSAAELAAQ